MNKTILLIGLLLGLASCRSSKITKPVYSKAPKAEILIDSVQAAHFNFNWMSAKISGKYNDPDQSFSFKGSIKIRKDSIIWMTISPGLGLELGRILIDPDTIHFMNRFEKTYYKSSYADLSEKIQSPLSFKRIQALLIGNSLSEFELKKYFCKLKDQNFMLSSASPKQLKKLDRSKRKSDQEIYLASINPQNSKIISQQYKNLKLDRTLTVKYEDFEAHDNKQIAKSIDLKVLKSQKIKLSLSYSKINLNKEFKFPFSVPESYEIIH